MTEIALAWSKDQIDVACKGIATEISATVGDSPCVLVPILAGAFHFAHEVAARLKLTPSQMYLEPVVARSYSEKSQGAVEILVPPSPRTIQGKVAVVLDDICDSGATLSHVCEACAKAGALRVYSAVLIRRVESNYRPTWSGFEAPRGTWYLGFGMDGEGGAMRFLPFIIEERSR